MINRKILMQEIIDSFNDSVNKLKYSLDADACEFKSVYSSDDENIEDLKYHYVFLYFKNYALILMYQLNGMMGMSKSILETRCCPWRNNEKQVNFSFNCNYNYNTNHKFCN